MPFSSFPKPPLESREEIFAPALPQPRVHETASINESQVHSVLAESIPLLTIEQDSTNLAIQKSTLNAFPWMCFYICPESDIVLMDELETLYEFDGVFAHYIPSTGWKGFYDLLQVIALDPFYTPVTYSQFTKIEVDAGIERADGLAAFLFDKLKRFPKLEEVILLSPGEERTALLAKVQELMKSYAFREWLKSAGKGKDKDEDEEAQMKKALLNGWEYRAPKITVLAYEFNEGGDQMLAMKRAILPYKL